MSEETPLSVEDIDAILQTAKISENQIYPTSQVVCFGYSNFDTTDYKLLELDKDLLARLEKGETLRILGDDDENAVLCTDDSTYQLIESETSNSLLLCENLIVKDELSTKWEKNTSDVEVKAVLHTILEVNPTKPNYKKLFEILEKTSYKGPELEYKINPNELHTLKDLLSSIQSSRKELTTKLNNIDIVITINGKLRLLDFNYHLRVLNLMLQLIEEHSWRPDEIRFEETIETLRDLAPEDVLVELFNLYTENTKIIDGEQLYRYKEDAICRLFAKALLRSAERFDLRDFTEAWKSSVPEGMDAREDMLLGMAVADRKKGVIFGLEEEKLPEDVEGRLEVLFEKKEAWSKEEIAPYVMNLVTDAMDVNALLANYTRSFNVDGIKYYCSKNER